MFTPNYFRGRSAGQSRAIVVIIILIIIVALLVIIGKKYGLKVPARPGADLTAEERTRILESLKGDPSPLSAAEKQKVLTSLQNESGPSPLSAEEKVRILESLK